MSKVDRATQPRRQPRADELPETTAARALASLKLGTQDVDDFLQARGRELPKRLDAGFEAFRQIVNKATVERYREFLREAKQFLVAEGQPAFTPQLEQRFLEHARTSNAAWFTGEGFAAHDTPQDRAESSPRSALSVLEPEDSRPSLPTPGGVRVARSTADSTEPQLAEALDVVIADTDAADAFARDESRPPKLPPSLARAYAAFARRFPGASILRFQSFVADARTFARATSSETPSRATQPQPTDRLIDRFMSDVRARHPSWWAGGGRSSPRLGVTRRVPDREPVQSNGEVVGKQRSPTQRRKSSDDVIEVRVIDFPPTVGSPSDVLTHMLDAPDAGRQNLLDRLAKNPQSRVPRELMPALEAFCVRYGGDARSPQAHERFLKYVADRRRLMRASGSIVFTRDLEEQLEAGKNGRGAEWMPSSAGGQTRRAGTSAWIRSDDLIAIADASERNKAAFSRAARALGYAQETIDMVWTEIPEPERTWVDLDTNRAMTAEDLEAKANQGKYARRYAGLIDSTYKLDERSVALLRLATRARAAGLDMDAMRKSDQAREELEALWAPGQLPGAALQARATTWLGTQIAAGARSPTGQFVLGSLIDGLGIGTYLGEDLGGAAGRGLSDGILSVTEAAKNAQLLGQMLFVTKPLSFLDRNNWGGALPPAWERSFDRVRADTETMVREARQSYAQNEKTTLGEAVRMVSASIPELPVVALGTAAPPVLFLYRAAQMAEKPIDQVATAILMDGVGIMVGGVADELLVATRLANRVVPGGMDALTTRVSQNGPAIAAYLRNTSAQYAAGLVGNVADRDFVVAVDALARGNATDEQKRKVAAALLANGMQTTAAVALMPSADVNERAMSAPRLVPDTPIFRTMRDGREQYLGVVVRDDGTHTLAVLANDSPAVRNADPAAIRDIDHSAATFSLFSARMQRLDSKNMSTLINAGLEQVFAEVGLNDKLEATRSTLTPNPLPGGARTAVELASTQFPPDDGFTLLANVVHDIDPSLATGTLSEGTLQPQTLFGLNRAEFEAAFGGHRQPFELARLLCNPQMRALARERPRVARALRDALADNNVFNDIGSLKPVTLDSLTTLARNYESDAPRTRVDGKFFVRERSSLPGRGGGVALEVRIGPKFDGGAVWESTGRDGINTPVPGRINLLPERLGIPNADLDRTAVLIMHGGPGRLGGASYTEAAQTLVRNITQANARRVGSRIENIVLIVCSQGDVPPGDVRTGAMRLQELIAAEVQRVGGDDLQVFAAREAGVLTRYSEPTRGKDRDFRVDRDKTRQELDDERQRIGAGPLMTSATVWDGGELFVSPEQQTENIRNAQAIQGLREAERRIEAAANARRGAIDAAVILLRIGVRTDAADGDRPQRVRSTIPRRR